MNADLTTPASPDGYFTEENSIETVNARMAKDVNPRLAEIMASLVKHLHNFARETELTQEEWEFGIDFLTRTGQICTQERQEFILLSDTLGLSMLVDAINNRRPQGATENTVFGPFHVEGCPVRQMGDRICLDGKGESCLFMGRVLDLDGNPVAGARIDVWSDNAEGYYDVQQPDIQPKWNNRGVFVTAEDGRYSFIGIKPVSYPIPDDGPVGKMLASLGRHPYRPAHMHYMVRAEGFQKLVTHTFVGGDPYLESDTVFGVKKTLVAPFTRVEGDETLWRSDYDFVLARPDQTR
ncbi:6-chlorohydroxyquinol-1,2-dioxygenase [Rhizobium dioscoreae]|uniref:intradiol ring-cleavage dioxygenase n=1 Tax=Rhizobium dioscoreae TaxID=2653122 RepID=UPI00126075A4|nr:intradiol ring-cleavage dioxygenase [Rhizobium dioscoreae]GES46032.1 6-chlorohydroxyquinol-1,2-dioxygenase [Rhizobium dioscoreae]